MKKENETDYNLTPSQAKTIAIMLACEKSDAKEYLQKYFAKDGGINEAIDLLVEFSRMAESVNKNTADALELFLITEKGYYPWEAEKLNLPSLMGACRGVTGALGVNQSKVCHGCACKLGSHANQSLVTQYDLTSSIEEREEPFLCHEEIGENGEVSKKCRGYAQHLKRKIDNKND